MNTLSLAEHALLELDFKYGRQILAALLPMCLTVTWHSLGINVVHTVYKRFGRPVMHGPHRAARTAVVIAVVTILLLTHFGEVVIWAAFYHLIGLVHNLGLAMYFSINAYTTMGDGNILLADEWRGFGNFESMTGFLMFGWSTAVLADIVQRLHSVED
ncbi:MAG: hypothetical protein JNK99_04070 [Candidatus Accumulibacter sp.]|uniref:ion channel n=1 Tax=Accumulibacter sp. TaxID=2053492 RepID=UPI001A38DC21|nr:ion channel [Accumulibacter sp.]MBL8393916.1 hypothetical protein [Accumulibacter sp.]